MKKKEKEEKCRTRTTTHPTKTKQNKQTNEQNEPTKSQNVDIVWLPWCEDVILNPSHTGVRGGRVHSKERWGQGKVMWSVRSTGEMGLGGGEGGGVARGRQR